MWEGEGWYVICWSDGGRLTNDGALWFETKRQMYDELQCAEEWATDTHLPYTEYLGDGLEPSMEVA